MVLTQETIDVAVMTGKNATYKLAYELALGEKYGDDITCCVTKLKLIWLYTQALICQKEVTDAWPAENNCLSVEKAKELIGKINSMCIT